MTQPYLDAARAVLRWGNRKPNRTGIDTISAFGVNLSHDLRDGFPLLTTKKIDWFHIVAENLWFLSGDPKIAMLRRHGIKFWDAWADDAGRVPSAYGNFWRRFRGLYEILDHGPDACQIELKSIDQMRYAIDTLKANQWTRRAVITAWDPANAHLSKLPPCHVMMVFNVQNLDGVPHLCLHLTQRSADMFLGVPYNTAGYALILTLMSKWVGLPPGIFSHTLVDAHIYTRPEDWTEGDPVASGGTHETDANELLDHLPLMRRQIEREPRMMPVLDITEDFGLDDVPALLQRTKSELLEIFRLRFYDPHPAIRGAVAV